MEAGVSTVPPSRRVGTSVAPDGMELPVQQSSGDLTAVTWETSANRCGGSALVGRRRAICLLQSRGHLV